jgi:hypothetical protein
MSSFELIREPLSRPLNAARRIAEVSSALIFHPDQHYFIEEIRKLARDLPFFTDQVMSAFPGGDYLARELRHELNCVREDAVELANWTLGLSEKLRKSSRPGLDTIPGIDFAKMHARQQKDANEECGRKKNVVANSCNRALEVAAKVCAQADRADEEASRLSESQAGPSSHTEKSTDERPDAALSQTQSAVLSIIKAEPKGKGIQAKEIVRKLKGKHIEIAESTLRRHVLPGLKAHGVINHKAAGGYLVP